MNSGTTRIGMMLGATVIILLVPLRVGSWLVLAGVGAAIVTALVLGTLLPVAATATSTRLSVGVAGVAVVASLVAALVLVLGPASAGLLGIAVFVVGVVLHRAVVAIVERWLGAGTVAFVSAAVGAVAYAVVVCLAMVGGTTASAGVAVGIGAAAGLGEGVIAAQLLRRELPAA